MVHFRFLRLVVSALSAVLLMPVLSLASAQMDSLTYLKQLSLENLMEVEVTSVSKKSEKVMNTAAAIYVLTQEEIARSGYRSIPELLRSVPGVYVADIDNYNSMVSSRGFKNVFANKLLVLIDGRSVYSPLFSGVYWDVQDTLIEDIERIEVIRGPGSSTWGANAVNGVINIITKSSADTTGALVTVGSGNYERVLAQARFGGSINSKVNYRLYVKRHELKPYKALEDSALIKDGRVDRGGFRMDYAAATDQSFTLQGDLYQGDLYQGDARRLSKFGATENRQGATKIRDKGGNLLGRWEKKLSSESSLSLQAYYDLTDRKDLYLEELRQTVDIDVNHQFKLGALQSVVWGGGYRYSCDKTSAGIVTTLVPDSRDDELYNLFAQDQLALFNERLLLTFGAKYERNDYTGSEWQPSVRALWNVTPRHSVWGAVSRAVRTPTRAEHDMVVTVGSVSSTVSSAAVGLLGPDRLVPVTLNAKMFGNDRYESEEMVAYELGYRGQVSDQIYVDMSLFFNDYSQLRTQEPGVASIVMGSDGAIVFQPFNVDNKMGGEGYGFEAWARYDLNDWWNITASYSWLKLLLHSSGSDMDPLGESAEEDDPEHQFTLHSSMNLAHDVLLDSFVYYTSETNEGDVPDYWRFDLRLAWQMTQSIELSFHGMNLLDNKHIEVPTVVGSDDNVVPRTFYTQLSWRY